MNQKGIAPLIIVAIIVIAAIAVGVGIYTVKRGGEAGGGGSGNIPVYASAVENTEISLYWSGVLENIGLSGIDAKAYDIALYGTDSLLIAPWYMSKMAELGWTKENDYELTGSFDAYLIFKRGNDGALIMIDGGFFDSGFLILYGQWESIQPLWGIFVRH
jgi:hypothetical protein